MSNRSLESSIRSMLSEATDKASEKRKEIENVARPKDSIDSQPRTKQQEIQKKIIDEQEISTMSDIKRFAEMQNISDDLLEAAKKIMMNKKDDDDSDSKKDDDDSDSKKDDDDSDSKKDDKKKSSKKTQVDLNPKTKNPDENDMNEEVEQIDELDRQAGSILNRYISRTNPDYKSPKEIKKRAPGRALALKKKWGDKEYGFEEPKVKAVRREETEVAEDTVASAQKSADQKMKAATINAKATVQADKIKDQARKQAQMNSFELEGNPLVEAIKKMIREPKHQLSNDSLKGVKSADSGQSHLSDDYVLEGRKPKDQEQPREDDHPFAPRKADNQGKVTFKHKGKEYTDSVSNYQKHRGHYMGAQGADRKDAALKNYISSLGK